ncbi:MAG: ribonuclease E/G [Eubacteriales bacterium]|nr:ribonuclease E/G [Eubacteriales bacterium]
MNGQTRTAVLTAIRGHKLCFVYVADSLRPDSGSRRLTDIFFADESPVGGIYVGRVENLLPEMNACFIHIGDGRTCLLRNCTDVQSTDGRPLHKGAMVMVQIAKEGKERKAPIVTAKPELHGRHIIITLGKHGVGLSRKISDEETRRRLKKTGRKHVLPGCGVLFRTSAETVSEQVLAAEMAMLNRRAEDLLQRSRHTVKPRQLLAAETDMLKHVPDDAVCHTDLADVADALMAAGRPVHLHSPADLSRIFGTTADVERALRRTVYLKSGANIVIEETEAMTVIDVNSAGAITGGRGSRDFATLNQEAAMEILFQLRIRNLSGIIMIDFVNMRTPAERMELIEAMTAFAADDYAPVTLYGFTKLGILEMSRKRVRTSLREYLKKE